RVPGPEPAPRLGERRGPVDVLVAACEYQRGPFHRHLHHGGVGGVEVEQVVDEPADGRHVLGVGEGGRHHQAASDLARAGVLQERIAERQLVGAQVVVGEAPHQPQVGAAGEQVGGGAVVVGRAAVVGEVAGVLVDAQQRQGGDRGRDGHGGGVQLAREQGGGGADALAD